MARRSDQPADPSDQCSALIEAIGELIRSAALTELVRGDRHHLAGDRNGDGDNEVAPKVEQASDPHAGLLPTGPALYAGNATTY